MENSTQRWYSFNTYIITLARLGTKVLGLASLGALVVLVFIGTEIYCPPLACTTCSLEVSKHVRLMIPSETSR